jgi:hypothetical protein
MEAPETLQNRAFQALGSLGAVSARNKLTDFPPAVSETPQGSAPAET